MNKSVKLFLSAFSQVGLVAVNVFQIAHQYYFGAFIVGFLISLLWSFNVTKIAFGMLNDRIVYSFGAGTGTVLGIIISNLIYK